MLYHTHMFLRDSGPHNVKKLQECPFTDVGEGMLEKIKTRHSQIIRTTVPTIRRTGDLNKWSPTFLILITARPVRKVKCRSTLLLSVTICVQRNLKKTTKRHRLAILEAFEFFFQIANSSADGGIGDGCCCDLWPRCCYGSRYAVCRGDGAEKDALYPS